MPQVNSFPCALSALIGQGKPRRAVDLDLIPEGNGPRYGCCSWSMTCLGQVTISNYICIQRNTQVNTQTFERTRVACVFPLNYMLIKCLIKFITFIVGPNLNMHFTYTLTFTMRDLHATMCMFFGYKLKWQVPYYPFLAPLPP